MGKEPRLLVRWRLICGVFYFRHVWGRLFYVFWIGVCCLGNRFIDTKPMLVSIYLYVYFLLLLLLLLFFFLGLLRNYFNNFLSYYYFLEWTKFLSFWYTSLSKEKKSYWYAYPFIYKNILKTRVIWTHKFIF